MPQIILGPNRAYPSIPSISGDVANHTAVLEAMREALSIHERRTSNVFDSFVRLSELVDLGIVNIDERTGVVEAPDDDTDGSTTHNHDSLYIRLDGASPYATGEILFGAGIRIEFDEAVSLNDSGGTAYTALILSGAVPGGTPVTDPNLGSVTFLASFENGTAGAEVYTPEIGPSINWSIVSGTQPTQVDGEISNAQAKFGTQSLYFKELFGAPNAGWASDSKVAGTTYGFAGDFTIETHIYIVDNTSEIVVMGLWDFTERQWILTLEAGNSRLNFLVSTTGSDGQTILAQHSWGVGTGVGTGAWHHIAVCRSGNNWYAWLDGVQSDQGTVSLAPTIYQPPGGAYLVFGQYGYQDGGSKVEVYLDNVRITDGVARYTTGFTPPAVPFDGSFGSAFITVGNASVATVVEGSSILLNAATEVVGAATLDSTLDVTGAATFSGLATFNGGLDVNSAGIEVLDLTHSGTVDLNIIKSGSGDLNISNSGAGSIVVTGTLNVSAATFVGLSSDDLSDVASIAMLDENETVDGSWTFTAQPAMRIGISGDYSQTSGDATWGATIWSIDSSWQGQSAAPNSLSTGVYGLRWIRASHTEANSRIGEGLYIFSNGTLYGGIGVGGIYTRSSNGVSVYDSTGTARLSLNHNGTNAGISTTVGSIQFTAATAGDYFQFLSGSQLRIYDSTNVDYLSIAHNGTTVQYDGNNIAAHQFNQRLDVLAGGLQVDNGIPLRIYDSTSNDYATLQHDGSDFNLSFVNTSAYSISGATQMQLTGGMPLYIRDAGSLRVYDATDTDYIALSHDGTNAYMTFSGTSYLNISSVQIRLTNNYALWGNDSGGTARTLVYVSNGDIAYLGSSGISTIWQGLSYADTYVAGAQMSRQSSTAHLFYKGQSVLAYDTLNAVYIDHGYKPYGSTSTDYIMYQRSFTAAGGGSLAFHCKTQDYGYTNTGLLDVEGWNGATWVPLTPSSDDEKRFFSLHTAATAINVLASTYTKFRITIYNAGEYSYVTDAAFAISCRSTDWYLSLIEVRDFTAGTWSTKLTGDTSYVLSGWPATFACRYGVTSFRSSAGGVDGIRFEFTQTAVGDGGNTVIYNGGLWGSYPHGIPGPGDNTNVKLAGQDFRGDHINISGGYKSQSSVNDAGEAGQFAFMDLSGSTARFGSYNWDTATWQPVAVRGSTINVDAVSGDVWLSASTGVVYNYKSGVTAKSRVFDSGGTNYLDLYYQSGEAYLVPNTGNLVFYTGHAYAYKSGTHANLSAYGSNGLSRIYLQHDTASGYVISTVGSVYLQAQSSAYVVGVLGGAGLRVLDSTNTKYYQVNHDGTDVIFNLNAATADYRFQINGSTKWVIDGSNGGLLLSSNGGYMRIYDSSNTDYGQFQHDGTDFNFSFVTTTDVNFTGFSTDFVAGNYRFNANQTVGAGQDNYVLTYDNATGKIGLEAAGGGTPTGADLGYKYKTAAESVFNSTTLQDDNHFTGWSLDAGAYYAIEGFIDYDQDDAATDLKIVWSFTNAPVAFTHSWAAGGTVSATQTLTSTMVLNSTAGTYRIYFHGRFRANTTTGGTCKVQWALNATAGVGIGITMNIGSWMRVYKLS